jgi:O-antigen ligase
MARLPGFATFSLIERFHICEHHFTACLFLESTALDIEHVFTFLLVGCVVALIARQRELAPAIGLAMIFGGMALVASLSFVIRGGDYAYLLRLGWYFTDSLAVALGALIVRTLRSNVTKLRSNP